jgi:hypothetical protein
VLEKDRSIEQRVSALDGLPSAEELATGLFRLPPRLDLGTLKLALEVGDTRVFVGKSADGDDLFCFCRGAHGGGGGGWSRTVLASRGIAAAWSQNAHRSFAYGIVADDVLAVRVANCDAVLKNNVFLAEAPVASQVVLTRAAGDQLVDFPTSPSGRH